MQSLKSTLTSKSTSISTINKTKVDVDRLVIELREKLRDPYLGKAFVKRAAKSLPESELYSIADFASREGAHPGKLFVSICSKEINATLAR